MQRRSLLAFVAAGTFALCLPTAAQAAKKCTKYFQGMEDCVVGLSNPKNFSIHKAASQDTTQFWVASIEAVLQQYGVKVPRLIIAQRISGISEPFSPGAIANAISGWWQGENEQGGHTMINVEAGVTSSFDDVTRHLADEHPIFFQLPGARGQVDSVVVMLSMTYHQQPIRVMYNPNLVASSWPVAGVRAFESEQEGEKVQNNYSKGVWIKKTSYQ